VSRTFCGHLFFSYRLVSSLLLYNNNSEITPEISTLRTLISLTERWKNLPLAMEMFAAMIRMHGQPDNLSYNIIVRMCIK
jgi:hypothetical protein